MSTTTSPYWHPLTPEQARRWRWLEGQLQELVLSQDRARGKLTRLTCFLSSADTAFRAVQRLPPMGGAAGRPCVTSRQSSPPLRCPCL